MIIIENHSDSDNTSDNDDKILILVIMMKIVILMIIIPVDSPHKGLIMLGYDVTVVESKNNSRVSGDLRRHVPHWTSLWCDIFTQHRPICIVVSSYESISSYMSICIQNCVRRNWLWCLVTQQSNQRWILLTKDNWFFALMFSLLLACANFWSNSRFAGVEKRHHVFFRIHFH